MRRQTVLDINCFAGDLDAAATAIIERARSGEGGTVCLANVHVIVTAQRDLSLRSALNESWLVLPDGAPIAWAQRRSGAPAERIAGADLMLAVLERGQSAGLRHFLFGSTPEVITGVEANVCARFSKVEIVGRYAPPVSAESASTSLAAITATRPHIVWVALGAPKQELWAACHTDSLAPAIVISVGAAFDFHAGTRRRAPGWMQRGGLEWLHRLVSEPRRLAWRYINTNTRFVALYTADILRNSHTLSH
jgi:N-acetylglucosaminyldiphosphoundecaprenol N-acetyl-beta-D-mannosaminyltransferase